MAAGTDQLTTETDPPVTLLLPSAADDVIDNFVTEVLYTDIISEETAQLLQVILICACAGAVSLLGTAANLVNIYIFMLQGLNDSVTISLLGLTISDLCSLLAMVWLSICFNPLVRYSPDISFNSIDVQYLTACWPHICFARITSWITAYITFERCLCIAMPLKVKQTITPRRTVYVITFIYLTVFLSVSPVYKGLGLGPSFNVKLNRTMFALVYASDGQYLLSISNSIAVIVQVSSFAVVILCTVILTKTLAVKSKWRAESGNAAALSSSTERDRKVIQMVTLISTIFIVCFLPCIFHLLLEICYPAYSIRGRYRNSYVVCWSCMKTLEAVNSSISIFVYYKMSSKYRVVFREALFKREPIKKISN
ncbi:galanin-like G-protein coupled receptor npr-9 [Physella acuta]|uniref:galanin-like G-protein coupled receptor npr-9 n=1 Tax=Physella acuta TaxID=109671 RepID=UPI0027DCA832|nr:galanin-like G-protein coupled receptor npr-9 [Physella acuta]